MSFAPFPGTDPSFDVTDTDALSAFLDDEFEAFIDSSFCLDLPFAPSDASPSLDPALEYVPGFYPADQSDLYHAHLEDVGPGYIPLSMQPPRRYSDSGSPDSLSWDCMQPESDVQLNIPACVNTALVLSAPPLATTEATPPTTPLLASGPEVLPELDQFLKTPTLSSLSACPSSYPCPSISYTGASSSVPSLSLPVTPYASPSPLVCVKEEPAEDDHAAVADDDDDDTEHVVPSRALPVSSSKARATAPSKRESKKPARGAPYLPTALAPGVRSAPGATDGLKVSRRRNRRVDASSATPPSLSELLSPDRSRLVCPHCSAEPPFTLPADRSQDFQRHLVTHTREDDLYACCGVPLHLAAQYGLAGAIPGSGATQDQVYVYAGMEMIGGCREAMSRKDALTRHLRGSPRCTGDTRGAWLKGNREKAAQAAAKAEAKAGAKTKGKGRAQA